MTYTLDRFPAKPRAADQAEEISLVKESASLSVWSGSLGRILSRVAKKKEDTKDAQKTMLAFMKNAQRAEEESGPDTDLMGRLLGRMLRYIGKKIIKSVVKPIFRFAANMARSLIRITARAVLRFVIVPVFEAVAAFAVANPITAGILAVAAIAGGGYYAWKKFFSTPEAEDLTTGGEEEVSNEAEHATDVQEIGAQAQVEGQEVQAQEQYQPTAVERIEAPIKRAVAAAPEVVREFVAPKKKGRPSAFKGFGDDVDGYIREAVQMFPILPLADLRGFIKMEAGWTGAMSPTGAIGTGQFIQPTWDALAATPEGQKIGMTKIGKRFRKDDDPRRNKRVNTLATALLASQNAKMLKKNGLPITGENLYMLHNIGPGIIPVMLGKPASDQTLLAMRQNGMTKNMTASEFLQFQKGRFNTAYQEANTGTQTRTDMPQLAQATTADPPKTGKQKIAGKVTSTPPLLTAGNDKQTDLIRGPGKSIVSM